MPAKYHGLRIVAPDSGDLRFGINQLIGSCQSWVWGFEPDLPEALKASLTRFANRAYWQCARKCQDTVHKLNKAVFNLGRCMDIFEREEEYMVDGAPLERAGVYLQAAEDLPYHFDSLLSYLRILADCVSFAIPFFYSTRKSIANRSFREHQAWFTKKEPDFDPDYSSVLREKAAWFDKLAGKHPKGVRDLVFHQFATYQLGLTRYRAGESRIAVDLVTPEGIREPDFVFTVDEIIVNFFSYLDATYELFGRRIANELAPLLAGSLEERSLFMKFTAFPDLQSSYRLYPSVE